ncbi:MAG: GNAT family N-acetyltransferase [Actinomycetota bacterium]|nr:GNAT family N-acetyltransferase [Actinomycetota bacterium]
MERDAVEEPPELTEGHVRLEALRAKHAKELAPLLNDRSLHRFTGGQPLSPAALEERYRRWEARRSPDGHERWFNWVIRRQDDGRAVGVAQATIRERQAEVAWTVARRWQDRGYAKRVAEMLVRWLTQEMGLEVIAHINPNHAASEAIATAAGLAPTADVEEGERVWRMASDRNLD